MPEADTPAMVWHLTGYQHPTISMPWGDGKNIFERCENPKIFPCGVTKKYVFFLES